MLRDVHRTFVSRYPPGRFLKHAGGGFSAHTRADNVPKHPLYMANCPGNCFLVQCPRRVHLRFHHAYTFYRLTLSYQLKQKMEGDLLTNSIINNAPILFTHRNTIIEIAYKFKNFL